MSSELHEQLQSTLGNTYHVERELGGGGMSRIFLAEDELQRPVVVKVLSPDLAAGVSVERFKREIKVAAHLHHPNIVPVLSAGQTSDLLYYTMPLIEGETLRALIDREGQLPLDRVLSIARDVADALDYAHRDNIVHRDIKPENILIERATGHALVADFGIARAIERAADLASVTSTGLTLGTPTYMSPEQAAAERRIDGRSDIYSLACVLYEMLSGAPPFTGPTARAIIAQHVSETPRSLAVVRPDVPTYVDSALQRALAKAPAGRFDAASDFARALTGVREPPNASWMRLWRRIAGGAMAIMAISAAWYLTQGAPTNTKAAAPAMDASRIAVLYLDAPQADTQLTSIARGLTRDVIYVLQRVPDLRLISEAGIRRFAKGPPLDSVARTLEAGTVVTGSIDRLGDSLEVDLRLVDGSTLVEKRSIRVRQAQSNLVGLRDTVVRALSRELLPTIGREIEQQRWRAATRSGHAWELRQRAQDIIEYVNDMPSTPRDFGPQLRLLIEAESLLVRAADADRSWVEPVVQRGWVQYQRSLMLPTRTGAVLLDSAMATAQLAATRWRDNPRVLELRGEIEGVRLSSGAAAHTSLGDSAEADLRAATAADPHLVRAWNRLSYLLSLKRDSAGSLQAARRALEVDGYERTAGNTMVRLVFQHLFDRRADSARSLCATARRRFPDDTYVQACELSVLGWYGAGSADLAAIRRALDRTEKQGVWPLEAGMFVPGHYGVAAVLARSGFPDSARALVKTTRERLRAAGLGDEFEINEAQALAAIGDRDDALRWLERAVKRNPAVRLRIILFSPWYDALRGSPRWQDIVKAP